MKVKVPAPPDVVHAPEGYWVEATVGVLGAAVSTVKGIQDDHVKE